MTTTSVPRGKLRHRRGRGPRHRPKSDVGPICCDALRIPVARRHEAPPGKHTHAIAETEKGGRGHQGGDEPNIQDSSRSRIEKECNCLAGEGRGEISPNPRQFRRASFRLCGFFWRVTLSGIGRRSRSPRSRSRPGGASLAYWTHLAISASHVEPAGTLYSNSIPTGMAHLFFFRHWSTSLIGVSPWPHGMFSESSWHTFFRSLRCMLKMRDVELLDERHRAQARAGDVVADVELQAVARRLGHDLVPGVDRAPSCAGGSRRSSGASPRTRRCAWRARGRMAAPS